MSCKCFNTTSVPWVLDSRDSGASNHMISKFDALTNIDNRLVPIIILQPDGRQIKVEKAGMVQLGPDIWLKDVLYTPCLCSEISTR